MRFAKLENNIVVQIQPNKEKGFVEVDDSVCCGMILENGKFITPTIVKTEEELEQIRINAINQKANSIIYSKYSIEKQSSAQLGIYGDEYLATMKAFIKKVIDISNKAIDDVIPADEVDWAGLDK